MVIFAMINYPCTMWEIFTASVRSSEHVVEELAGSATIWWEISWEIDPSEV